VISPGLIISISLLSSVVQLAMPTIEIIDINNRIFFIGGSLGR
jgi:hypothetical protein